MLMEWISETLINLSVKFSGLHNSKIFERYSFNHELLDFGILLMAAPEIFSFLKLWAVTRKWKRKSKVTAGKTCWPVNGLSFQDLLILMLAVSWFRCQMLRPWEISLVNIIFHFEILRSYDLVNSWWKSLGTARWFLLLSGS